MRRNDEVGVGGDPRLRRRAALARAPAPPRTPASASRSCASSRACCRSSASASATRPSARRTAPPSNRAPELLHGKTSLVHHDGVGVLAGLPDPFTATRYHSLAIDPATVPDELEVTARTDSGVIMAVRHRIAAGRGRAVPPGERADRGRAPDARQLAHGVRRPRRGRGQRRPRARRRALSAPLLSSHHLRNDDDPPPRETGRRRSCGVRATGWLRLTSSVSGSGWASGSAAGPWPR